MRKIIIFMFFNLIMLSVGLQASAQSRYEANVTAWKPAGSVEGFEYKVALKPELFQSGNAMSSFVTIWEALHAKASQKGFALNLGKGKIRQRTISYFDTADLALKKAGFIIRVNETYKDGRPNDEVRFTVKVSGKKPEFILGAPLKSGTGRGKISTEDNPYEDGGKIVSRLEKSLDMKIDSASLGNLRTPTLQQFSRFAPLLETSGLAPSVQLKPVVAYSYSAKMGNVDLGGVEAEVSLEAWTDGWSGKTLVLEVSLGVEDQDYYTIPKVVAAGDRFFQDVMIQGLADLRQQDEKFSGSKLLLLRGL